MTSLAQTQLCTLQMLFLPNKRATVSIMHSKWIFLPLSITYIALLIQSWTPETLQMIMPGSLQAGLTGTHRQTQHLCHGSDQYSMWLRVNSSPHCSDACCRQVQPTVLSKAGRNPVSVLSDNYCCISMGALVVHQPICCSDCLPARYTLHSAAQ